MYRKAPPRPDPLLVVPGEGLREILVGRAVPADVFGTFGGDAWVTRDPDGNLNGINYSYADEDTHDPDREGNDARPCNFLFEFGLLKAIKVGPYQSALYTTGGLRYESKRSAILDVLGPPSETLRTAEIETVRYTHLGIEFAVSTDLAEVMSFTIFCNPR